MVLLVVEHQEIKKKGKNIKHVKKRKMETRKMKNGNGYGNHANVKGLRVNVKLIDGKWRLNCKIIIYKQILVEKLLLDIDRDKDRWRLTKNTHKFKDFLVC